MEAIIARAPARNSGTAAAEWLRASRRLGRAALRLTQHFLVSYSRAALLLRGRDRPARRI
jgi:hypothetical protein